MSNQKKNHFYINAHNSIIIIIAPKWEQVKCPSTDNWINKMCYIHTMDYYSSIKRTDTCYTWVNLKTCYVKEASHKELHILHDSIYMKCAEQVNLQDKKQISVHLRLKLPAGTVTVLAKECWVYFGGNKNVQKL